MLYFKILSMCVCHVIGRFYSMLLHLSLSWRFIIQRRPANQANFHFRFLLPPEPGHQRFWITAGNDPKSLSDLPNFTFIGATCRDDINVQFGTGKRTLCFDQSCKNCKNRSRDTPTPLRDKFTGKIANNTHSFISPKNW